MKSISKSTADDDLSGGAMPSDGGIFDVFVRLGTAGLLDLIARSDYRVHGCAQLVCRTKAADLGLVIREVGGPSQAIGPSEGKSQRRLGGGRSISLFGAPAFRFQNLQ